MTSRALDPPLPPVTNCHTLSDPLERDVLYDVLYYIRLVENKDGRQTATRPQDQNTKRAMQIRC